jgi:hypothetical protein
MLVDDGAYLGELCKYAHSLGLFVSIVSNGSLIVEDWFKKYASFVHIMAISCDR